jgi:hypothetical protein
VEFHVAPTAIGSMSLQPAIPRRVALQQSPPPLHRLSSILKERLRLEKTITLNGNCVFSRLSLERGHLKPSQVSILRPGVRGIRRYSDSPTTA